MKELNRRASGQAFEVILSPSTSDSKADFLSSPLRKRETSLDEIKKKLEAAEERRKVRQKYIIKVANRCEQLQFFFSVGLSHQVLLTRCKNSLLSFFQSQEAEALKHFAEKREHEKEVIQKALEESCNFMKMTQEKLDQKMEAFKENRTARMTALMEKLKEKVSSY